MKEIESINSQRDRRRIVSRIKQLGDELRPRGCEKLSGQDKYRIRQGRFRIVYSIDEHELTVDVVKIGQRKDVYR